MISINNFGNIVSKVHHVKKLWPITLLHINKSLKIDLYCAILPFNLAVFLQFKSNRKFFLNDIKIL